MADETDSGYAVGYGKPPKETRFKPGQSGNPKGRPRGSRNFSTELDQELNTRIAIIESGERKTITKRKAAAKQIANKAASGDPKAIAIVLGEDRAREVRSERNPPTEVLGGEEDRAVFKNFVGRLTRNIEQNNSAVPEPDDPPASLPPGIADDPQPD